MTSNNIRHQDEKQALQSIKAGASEAVSNPIREDDIISEDNMGQTGNMLSQNASESPNVNSANSKKSQGSEKNVNVDKQGEDGSAMK